MNVFQIFLIGIGLSMDAFAISLCQGLAMKKIEVKNAFKTASVFGGFQALMPLIGFFLGNIFSNKISQYGNIIAFIILAYLGYKMIKEGREADSCDVGCQTTDIKKLLALGVATSIDALAVGFTFSLVPNINIYFSVILIGITTFMISSAGVFTGNKFGTMFGSKAQYLGGIILILIGVKTLMGSLV